MTKEDTRTARLVLVRHAHAEWRPDDDQPLSPRGQTDAARLTGLLAPSRPAAIYSSPARRVVQTIEGLAEHLRLQPILLRDLREREMPTLPESGFEEFVRASWLEPAVPEADAEPMIEAQARGLQVVRFILSNHRNQDVIVATHGNLLALIANVLDPAYGYEFWKCLTFPDVYELRFRFDRLERVRRLWDEGG
jgi:2,3-bisphosphoglycerate-dependent phosphoglycerate mutase